MQNLGSFHGPVPGAWLPLTYAYVEAVFTLIKMTDIKNCIRHFFTTVHCKLARAKLPAMNADKRFRR